MSKEKNTETKTVNTYQFDSYPIEDCKECPFSSRLEDSADQNDSSLMCKIKVRHVTPCGRPDFCPLEIADSYEVPDGEPVRVDLYGFMTADDIRKKEGLTNEMLHRGE